MEKQIAAAILKGAGLDDAQIDTLDAITGDAVKDFKADDYLAGISTHQKTTLLNDPTFYESIPEDKIPAPILKKIEGAQYGRFVNEFKDVATKELGLKEGEDFTTEDAGKLKIFAKKVATAYAGKGATADGVKKLQQDLIDAVTERDNLKTETATKITEAVNGEKASTAKTMERLVGAQKVAAIPNLNVKPHIVSEHLLNSLKTKYTVAMDPDTLDFKLTQKAAPTLDVIDTTVEGGKLTFDVALERLAKAEGLIAAAKDDKIDPKTGKVTVEVSGDTIEIPDYIKNKIEPPKKS